MLAAQGREFLSFGDALFLYLEREGAPLNIASLAIFEGEISVGELRKFVASKLPQIPRYLQRVVIPPFSVGMPYWEFTRDFDLAYHVREISLKRGTDVELRAAASRILSPTMDRRHPLWDLTLIRGLNRGRTGMIARLHHCLADGISGMTLLNLLMSSSPEVPRIGNRRLRIPANGHDEATKVVDSAMQSWFSIIERLLQAGTEVLTLFQRASGISQNGTAEPGQGAIVGRNGERDDIMRLVSGLSELPERLPFNMLCRGPQRYEWTEAPLADLKAIRSKSGATVNDVILTLLTAAFQRYSESRGVKTRGRSLRIVVPVSTRRHHEPNQLGNHISFAPFSAPLGIRNPKKLLSAVHDRMQFVKTAHVAEFVAFAGTLLGAIPAPLQGMIAPLVSELPISLCNTICTNVPGPKDPLYLLGHKMLSAYPYVPIGGEMGINCAVLSYNGTVYFGFTGDIHAAPDLEKLPRFVDDSVADLMGALGLRKTRTVRAKSTSKTIEAGAESPPEAVMTKGPEPVTNASSAPKARAAAAGSTSTAA